MNEKMTRTRKEVIEAYERLRSARKKKGFVIECPNPKCGNNNHAEIEYLEEVQQNSPIRVEGEMLFIDGGHTETHYDTANGRGLECYICGQVWDIPSNAKVEWV